MALTNNLKTQVDLPVWEWCRFAPVNSGPGTTLATPRDGSSRYIFYFGGAQLYKYDTIGDAWSVLSVGATPATALTAKYVKNQGYRGNILSASSTTVQLPSTGVDLTGYKIRIISGKGAGQERTITSTNAEVVHDSGLVTTVTANVLTDSLKKWRFNQWEGYAARLIFNTGYSQYREVVYNDPTSLTVFDANYDARNYLMAPFSAGAPYAVPVTTAGAQAMLVLYRKL